MFSHAKVAKTRNAAMSTKKLHNKIIILIQLLMKVFEVVNNNLIIIIIIINYYALFATKMKDQLSNSLSSLLLPYFIIKGQGYCFCHSLWLDS